MTEGFCYRRRMSELVDIEEGWGFSGGQIVRRRTKPVPVMGGESEEDENQC